VMCVVGLFVFWTGLFSTLLWPNSFGVGESGLTQLKFTSSQLVYKQGPLCRNPGHVPIAGDAITKTLWQKTHNITG